MATTAVKAYIAPMNRTDCLSLQQLRNWLRLHQKRLRYGDPLPSITSLADRAGVHRDTLYALMNGDRVEGRTQIVLSRVAREVDAEVAGITKTKVLSIRIENGYPAIKLGAGLADVFLRIRY